MEKIVIAYDESEMSKELMTTLSELFPECEIIGVPKDPKVPGMDGDHAPLQDVSQTRDVTGSKESGECRRSRL